MTAQQIFNKVQAHLLKQGVSSYSDDIGCAYRGPNGTMCAVGCLIPDHLYEPGLEQGVVAVGPARGSDSLPTKRINELLTELGLDQHKQLLRHLQQVHDAYMPRARSMPHRNMEAVKCGLVVIAKHYNLVCSLKHDYPEEIRIYSALNIPAPITKGKP